MANPKPFKLSLTIYQGATFDKTVTWKAGPEGGPYLPVDLTGCMARMQIRETLDSPVVLITLTTANGRLELGGAAGTIRFLIEDEDTAALNFDRGVYDLEIAYPDGTVVRKMSGSVIFSREVTRDVV